MAMVEKFGIHRALWFVRTSLRQKRVMLQPSFREFVMVGGGPDGDDGDGGKHRRCRDLSAQAANLQPRR